MTVAEMVDKFCEKHGLSPRESQAVFLFAMGHAYWLSAKKMGIKLGTVATYHRRVYEKVGVRSREELMGALLEYAAEAIPVDQRRYSCLCGIVGGTPLDIGKECSACTSRVFDHNTVEPK